MKKTLFFNQIFQEALGDIEALGLKVTAHPLTHATSYAVIGGRSNARWWLVPLENGRVTASSLALFQPLLSSACIMKAFAQVLSRLGLSRIWARNIIYISGESALQQVFTESKPLSFAYFTGTDSPHRKLAVQVMDVSGNIKGYAKVSRNPEVQALLLHEANMLSHVKSLNLRTANIPNVLFSGDLGNASALVTDTLKTPKTKSVTKLQPAHLDFLRELTDKTKTDVQNKSDWLVDSLRNRFNLLENRLAPEWKARFEKAIAVIEQQKEYMGQPVMAHGDFTPWNTFVADGKLYVFDWEYAESCMPAGIDQIHFFLNQPDIRNKSASLKFELTKLFLNQQLTKLNQNISTLTLTIYLLQQNLKQIEKLARINNTVLVKSWDGDDSSAEILDIILN